MSASTFTEFVAVCFDGNQAKAAAALDMDRSHIWRICKGERGITPELAAKVEQVSAGRYTKEALIWPEGEAA